MSDAQKYLQQWLRKNVEATHIADIRVPAQVTGRVLAVPSSNNNAWSFSVFLKVANPGKSSDFQAEGDPFVVL